MKSALCTGILVFSLGAAIMEANKKFILITCLYNEPCPERCEEYIACIEKNLAHDAIDKIHVLYDTIKDDGCNYMHTYLESKPIEISYIQGRPTYDFCFTLANTIYKNRRIIIANADIYFNDTLYLLDTYDLADTFLACTRWNVQKDGSLKIYIWPSGQPAIYSQDAWFFQTPLQSFEDSSICLGVPHCDGKIAYQAVQAGLKVLNPCLSLQCCHLHNSGIRNYEYVPFPSDGKIMPLIWCSLEDEIMPCKYTCKKLFFYLIPEWLKEGIMELL